MEMLSEPENALHDLKIITDLQCKLHTIFQEMIPHLGMTLLQQSF